jgi:demethylmenaquinone methyltransferase / 2-methoxy-6-polyprenyl-1,4-benzoquinol methylase
MSMTPTLPTDEHKAEVVEAMFDRIAPRYDRLNRVLTFRLDVGWRRKTVRALALPNDATVLDIACGTGDLCRDLEAAGLRPIGVDFSAGMLASARTAAPLVRGDALQLPMPDRSVDGVTCGFALRNFVSLDGFFGECARVLRVGGRFAFLEVAEPEHALLCAGHHFYFRRVVPWLGGLLSDRAAYSYLPASTAYLPSPAALVTQLREHGFTAVERVALGLGAAQLLTGARA